jgi:hypothetical protein
MPLEVILRSRAGGAAFKLMLLPGLRMDIENRLRNLESLYRTTLSAAVAAKARYLALQGEWGCTEAAIERARAAWQTLESRKGLLVKKMLDLEKCEHHAVT